MIRDIIRPVIRNIIRGPTDGISAAGPVVLFQDNFTGSGNLEDHTPDIGTGWARTGGGAGDVTVSLGGARSNALTANGIWTSDDLGLSDYYIEFDVPALTGVVTCYVCARINGTTDFALGVEFYAANSWRFQKRVAGVTSAFVVDTGVNFEAGTLSPGDTMRIEIVGDTAMTFFINSVQKATGTLAGSGSISGLYNGANRSRNITNIYESGSL